MKQIFIEKTTLLPDKQNDSIFVQAGSELSFMEGETRIMTILFQLKILSGGDYGLRFDPSIEMAAKNIQLLGGRWDGVAITLYLKNTSTLAQSIQAEDVVAVGSFYEKISYRQIDETMKNGVVDLNVRQIETPTKTKGRRRAPKKKDQPAV